MIVPYEYFIFSIDLNVKFYDVVRQKL